MATIAVDFDGVLHSYDRGWRDGTIYGDWMPGAVTALSHLMQRHAVFVHTTRSPRQVARWIERMSGHGIECTTQLPRTWSGRRTPFWNKRGVLLVTNRKLAASAYIDDRAVRFESWEQTLNDLARYAPPQGDRSPDRHDEGRAHQSSQTGRAPGGDHSVPTTRMMEDP